MHSTHKVVFSSFVVLIIFVLVSAIKFYEAPRHVKAVDRVQSQTTETTMKTNYAEQQNMLRMEASYRNLPLSFEPNRGQTDPQVKFLSRAGNRTPRGERLNRSASENLKQVDLVIRFF